MDSSSSKQTKEKSNNRPTHYPKPTEYQIYENETLKKQNVTTKKTLYRRGGPKDDQIPPNSLFQIPESDKSRYLPPLDSNVGQSSKYDGKQYVNLNQPEESSCFKNTASPSQYNRAIGYLPTAPTYQYNNHSGNERSNNQKNMTQNNGKEQITSQISYGQANMDADFRSYQRKNNGVISENAGFDVNKNSSLICRAINYDGEPVTVNNEVIKDKLILSCRPRTYYGVGTFLRKSTDFEGERVPKYVYPPQVGVVDDVTIQQKTDTVYQQEISDQSPYTGTGKSTLVRSNAFDLGSMGMGEHLTEIEKQGISDKYEQQYRAIQCKRYTRNFKVFLWGLLIINLLLVLIGLSLLLLLLAHVLFRDYINTVIGQTGFTIWVWAAMVIALLIICVGIYGIITSVTRSRSMLLAYCIMATILAVIIIIFLLIFWIKHANLKTVEHSSMTSTFNMYRCHRLIRNAWDDLQVNHQCCGLEARGDWKYIPPSCCHAETKFQQLACINHFIQEDQAFKGGCRTKLEDYFTTMFLLITCLLVLALILLLLGILAALRLLKMYKIILFCRDMYLITP